MNYTTLSSWGPEKTPSTIKYLILFTAIAAILSAGAQSIFEQFNLFPGPQNFLSLSWWGLQKGYVWQPLTFLFVQESMNGLSFYFFIALFFHLYLLWMIGSAIIQLLGKGPFLRLYLIGGVAAGILTLLSMKISGQYEMLQGMTPALLIVLTVWSMAYPETEVLLFFLVPFKVKWIVVSLIGIMLLISLSRLDFTYFSLNLSAILIGYGYAVMAQSWYSPFPLTLKFDAKLAGLSAKIRRKMPFMKHSGEIKSAKGKVLDIESGRPLQGDDAFIDAMLAKISKKGENSLTWSEKKRMQEISRRKMQNR